MLVSTSGFFGVYQGVLFVMFCLQEKAAGAAAYKAKDFDNAITHFTAAWDIYDKDLSFLTNRAAAHFEKGDYDSVITDCTAAVEKGRAIMPIDWKMIARCYTPPVPLQIE